MNAAQCNENCINAKEKKSYERKLQKEKRKQFVPEAGGHFWLVLVP